MGTLFAASLTACRKYRFSIRTTLPMFGHLSYVEVTASITVTSSAMSSPRAAPCMPIETNL